MRTGPLRDLRRGLRADGRAPRAALRARRRRSGISLGATGTHPWSRWQDQRIIDTPHYRRNDELLRYVVWRNNTFGHARPRRHPGRRPCDRRPRRPAAVPPAPARAVRELAARRGREQRAALGPHRDLHAHVPALRRARTPTAAGQGWESYVRLLYETGSIDEHTQIWWSVRPHLAYPTVEIRICDAPARPRPSRARSRRSATRSRRGSRAPSTRASRSRSRRRG